MALANYSDLINSVQNWMGRDSDNDLLLVLPDIITLAEQEMYKDIRVPENQKNDYLKVTQVYEELPADWLEGQELRVLNNSRTYPLRFQSPQLIDDINPRTGNTQRLSVPTYYTIRGTKLQIDTLPQAIDSVSVSSATAVGTTVTIQCSQDHELTTDNFVTVTDSANEGYAGTFRIADVPTTTSFTYIVETTPTASPATGTIAYLVNNLELDYFYRWNGLTSTNPTNPILTNYPDIYLYGCLHQAAAWIESEQLAKEYYTKYRSAIDVANQRALDRMVSGSQLEMYNVQGNRDNAQW